MPNPRITVEAAGDFRRLYADLEKADSQFGKMGSTIKAGLAGAAVVGGAALAGLAVEAAKAASASQQSLGATETVFGKYADNVVELSKRASDAVGLSANQYRELANVTGAMLANSGAPLAKVTGLTEKLTKRAADLAATYGGTTKDAIESVNSLLRGEADPIERYGVSIKQSDVNARLAAKGLDKLTGAALKQAEQQARLELLFKQTNKAAGQFGRESDTIAGKGQRLGAKVEDLEAKFGNLLIPALSAGADIVDERLIPALDDMADWLTENKDQFAELGGTVKDTVLPPLKAAVDVAQAASAVFGDLPGPVKDLAVQAGIAALVLPRLTGAMSSVTGGAGSMITNLKDAEKRTAALSTAARNAAGIGGLLALTQGVQETDKALGILETTAGGALLGFSVTGGPWGAAIGAAGGAMVGLATHTNEAKTAADRSVTTWQTYAATLDSVTGATTRATKSMIIQDAQESKLFQKASTLGLSKATVIDALLGETKARDTLNAAMREEQRQVDLLEMTDWGAISNERNLALSKELATRKDNLKALRDEVGETDKSVTKTREHIALLREIPESVVTKVQALGTDASKREVADLVATYGLTPPQIKTVIEMTGVDASKREIQSLAKEIVESGNVKPADAWANFFAADLNRARGDAKAGTDDIKTLLSAAGDVSPNVRRGAFGQGLSGDLSALKGVASGGASTVGAALGAGIYNGLDGWAARIAGRASSIVTGAVGAAKAAGAIASPSKETEYLGRMLGEGLAVGMEKSTRRVQTAAGGLVSATIDKGLAFPTLEADVLAPSAISPPEVLNELRALRAVLLDTQAAVETADAGNRGEHQVDRQSMRAGAGAIARSRPRGRIA